MLVGFFQIDEHPPGGPADRCFISSQGLHAGAWAQSSGTPLVSLCEQHAEHFGVAFRSNSVSGGLISQVWWCSSSTNTVNLLSGGVVCLKDLTKDSERALMSALQPVSVAIGADQSSFQMYKTDVKWYLLTLDMDAVSRGTS